MTSSTTLRNNSSPGGGPSRPLKRGKACLTCRFLKIRCDGARPVCGPCSRSPKEDPCEYADGPGRSRTRALEETVSRLEARLREYEHPEETPPVALHNPYDHSRGQDNDATLRINVSGSSMYSNRSSPLSATSPLIRISSPHTGGSSGSSDRTASPAFEQRIALPATRNLLEWFFVHASAFGFFLNIPRFSHSALLPLDFGHQSRPCPGLLSTVYLWGIHLSPQPQHKDLEHTLLMRALRDTASDLSSSNPHPHRFLHTIQAETLLGYYFFRNGNVLEAKRHASSAASLALACGLNLHRSSRQQTSSSVPAFSDGSSSLSPTQDSIEEGERINAFWTVFTLYRSIAVAVDPPGSVCGVFDAPGCQVHTPWPLDMEMYKKNILPARCTSTVYEYLNHVQRREDEHQLASTNCMVTKASLLLHQASFVTGQYYPNMPARDAQSFLAAFQSLQNLIDNLRSQLSPLEELDRRNPSTRDIFLAHALVHAATIRLNEIFSDSEPSCRQSCVSSAQALLHGGGLSVTEFGCVNPIMGTLWASACQTLVQEVTRLRSGSGSWPSSYSSSTHSRSHHQTHSQAGREEESLAALRKGLSALTFISANSALMSEFITSSISDLRVSTYEYPRCILYDRDVNLDTNGLVDVTPLSRDTVGSSHSSPCEWDGSQTASIRSPSSALPTDDKTSTPTPWIIQTPPVSAPAYESFGASSESFIINSHDDAVSHWKSPCVFSSLLGQVPVA